MARKHFLGGTSKPVSSLLDDKYPDRNHRHDRDGSRYDLSGPRFRERRTYGAGHSQNGPGKDGEQKHQSKTFTLGPTEFGSCGRHDGMIDYEPILTGILGLATALIAYTAVIQKEREAGRDRPLFAVRARREGQGGQEFAIVNEGGQPALRVAIHAGEPCVRLDLMKVGEEVVLPAPAMPFCEVVIEYRGLSRPHRVSTRRFQATADGEFFYIDGSDKACGLINRIKIRL